MADPPVHITNGIPDGGTGFITTLGQTLLDGANLTFGATTDAAIAAGAAGTINAHLRSISRDIAAGVVLQAGGNTIGNVGQAGAPWAQNITQFGGSVISTGPGVGGVGIPRVTVSSDSSLAATQSGNWDIRNITGTIALPTGAATAAKQPAPGTAGSPSADVLTVQGVTGMTALKVDGTGGSFPVSGTLAVTQSGTWNITNISGTVSLPTGAATAAKQPSPSTAGSPSADVLTVQGAAGMTALKVNLFGNIGAVLDFAGQNAAGTISSQLVGGQYNLTPTAITSGNFSPLQLDANGNLKVNMIAGGGAGGTSSTFGSAFPTTGTAVGAKDATGTNMVALNLDASGNLKVNVAAGGASGGTSSNYGAAVPSTGTAVGFSDGTNMQLARVFDGDSGAGTQYSLGVLLKTPASGGAVDIGVSGQPLRTDPTGTTTQPVSGTVTVTQTTASNLNANVSGTVAATQSGIWNITNISGTVSLPTGAATSANQPTAAGLGSTTSGQTGNLSLGAVTTAAPTYVTAQTNALSLTTAGALRIDGSGATQPISGTITANQGGTWNITNISGTVSLPTGAATAANQCTAAASASTTAGQTGHLAMGSTTTGAPAYTTGQTNPLSLTTAGALRTDGSGVTQPVSGTFWQATQPVSGTITANQGGTWTVQPGNTANTTPWLVTPKGFQDSGGTDITDTVNHALKVNIVAGAGSGGTASTVGGAMPSSATVAMGSVTTGAPAYTTATANALSLTTTGNLRVDGSSVTQPISAAALPLPSGAATSANQPTNAAIGSTTSGQTGGLAMGAVTSGAPSYTTGQTDPLSLDTTGNLRVSLMAASASVVVTQSTAGNLNATVTGTVAATQSGSWNVGQSGTWQVDPLTPANWGIGTSTQNSATISRGVLALGQFNTSPTAITSGNMSPFQLNANGALRVDGSSVTQPVSGTVGISGSVAVTGTFWQTTQPVSGTVTVTQGTAANLNATVTGTVAATQSGTWTVQQGTPPWLIGGDVANAATDSGNPVKVGAVARTANPTAVTTGQRVNLMADKLGKLVVVGALRDLKGVQKTSISTTTETTVVTAGGAGVFQDVYAIVVTNKSATAVFVDFRDSTGGTVRMTLSAPAGDTRGFTVPVDSAMVQSTAANNWTATLSGAAASIEITMLYVSNL